MDRDQNKRKDDPGDEPVDEKLRDEEFFEDEGVADDADAREKALPRTPTVARKFDRAAAMRKRGRKKYRPLIIAGSTFLAILVIYAAVVLFVPEAYKPVEPPPDITSFTKYAVDTIESIKFEYRDGYTFTMSIARRAADTGYVERLYTIAGKSQFNYAPTAFSASVTALSNMNTSTFVVSNPKDYDVYGLYVPLVRVTFTSIEGEEKVVLLGNAAPVGTGYYAMLEGTGDIFIIGGYYAEAMLKKDMEYRILTATMFSAPMDQITDVNITKRGRTLAIHRQTADEIEAYGLYATAFMILEPYYLQCNEVYFEEKLANKLTNINANSVVIDFPEDYAEYGLGDEDNVTIVEIKGFDISKFEDLSVTITLGGDVPDDDTLCYGKIMGIASIYTFVKADFEFAALEYGDLMNVALWVHTISDVAKVEISRPGETNVMEFKQTGQDMDEAKLDGEVITENNARMLYTRVLQLYMFDVLPENAKIGQIEYTFKITYYDGREFTLSFARMNDRQFAVYRNGELTTLYSNINYLNRIFDGIRDIKAGETLKYVI